MNALIGLLSLLSHTTPKEQGHPTSTINQANVLQTCLQAKMMKGLSHLRFHLPDDWNMGQRTDQDTRHEAWQPSLGVLVILSLVFWKLLSWYLKTRNHLQWLCSPTSPCGCGGGAYRSESPNGRGGIQGLVSCHLNHLPALRLALMSLIFPWKTAIIQEHSSQEK